MSLLKSPALEFETPMPIFKSTLPELGSIKAEVRDLDAHTWVH